ncbi:MAG TPA: SDR family NAD(P)-dependent oxidoreductase [Acidobacteriota bacterium]|nr:SDR family NAD(P)-dependent oxidoreductase [Acidobacteriota bacterium]
MDLRGSTFLISGGSSGLGAACVRRFCRAGANVVIGDVNSSIGLDLVGELGTTVHYTFMDVTDEASVQRAVSVASDTYGGLSGAVNCAGIAPAERVLGKTGLHSLETYRKVINVNLIGTFNVVRLAAAAIAQAPVSPDGERGVIVNTASVSAFDGQIGQAAYSASKGGVAAMTLPLAREFARFGIRVVAIAPGIFDTPLLAVLPVPARQSLEQQVPFPPRLGKPDEFAALAQHIVENQMLNGSVIRLDGALRMAAK